MNQESIIILIIVSSFIAILGAAIIVRGILINKKEKSKKPKEEQKKAEVKEEPTIVEEKPLPVGIIKTEALKTEQTKDVEEFAPLREKETTQTQKKETPKSVSQQIKELSPEMKAILFSDVIKPKF